MRTIYCHFTFSDSRTEEGYDWWDLDHLTSFHKEVLELWTPGVEFLSKMTGHDRHSFRIVRNKKP